MVAATLQDPRHYWTLGRLARTTPKSVRVMFRHHVDLHGASGASVVEAVREPDAFLAAVDAAPEVPTWESADAAAMLDHLMGIHAVQRRQLGQLDATYRALQQAGGVSAACRRLRTMWNALADELTEHMHKEEVVLFPWIRSGRGRSAGAPVRVTMAEHDVAVALLYRLRDEVERRRTALTAAEQGMVDVLWPFMETLYEHVHLENQVLFPRALTA